MCLDQVTFKVPSKPEIFKPLKVPGLGNFHSAALCHLSVQVAAWEQVTRFGCVISLAPGGFAPVLQGGGESSK